jgi:hypothetical protein
VCRSAMPLQRKSIIMLMISLKIRCPLLFTCHARLSLKSLRIGREKHELGLMRALLKPWLMIGKTGKENEHQYARAQAD